MSTVVHIIRPQKPLDAPSSSNGSESSNLTSVTLSGSSDPLVPNQAQTRVPAAIGELELHQLLTAYDIQPSRSVSDPISHVGVSHGLKHVNGVSGHAAPPPRLEHQHSKKRPRDAEEEELVDILLEQGMAVDMVNTASLRDF